MKRARRHRGVAPAAIVIAVGLTGCFAQPVTQREESSASVTGTALVRDLGIDWEAIGDHGFVYLQVNTDGSRHHELMRVDLGTGESVQTTDLSGPFGISNFSASSAGVVVADASGGADEAAWLRPDGTLQRLPGPRALGPMVNGDGDVLASIVARGRTALAVQSAGETRWRTLVPHLSGEETAWWYDDTSVIVLRTGDDRTTWRRIHVDGRRTARHPIGYRPYVLGSSGGQGRPVMLVERNGPRAILWTPGFSRPLPSGWKGGCMSPDRSRLLLYSAAAVGILSLEARSAAVRLAGRPASKVLACDWVDEKFGP